ncbi:hypothetical protein FISHEDRAFT_37173, partial [Fistulina hepatica ATCC 64428]
FPERLRIPSKAHLPEVTLLGAGVRKVSFLRVKVYSIGFYADLNNPRIKAVSQFTSDMTPEQKIEHVVDNTTCLIRIVPVRTTNFTHLRDAFVRALYQRLSIAQKNQVMFSQEEIYNITTGISSVRTLFPNRTLEKGTPLDIVVTPPMPDNPRALIFRDLGAVMGSWVTTEFVLHYFSEDAPSPPVCFARRHAF